MAAIRVAACAFVSEAGVARGDEGAALALGAGPEAEGAAGASPRQPEQVMIIASAGHNALIKSFLPSQSRLVP